MEGPGALTDAELMTALAEGDLAGLRELYRRHAPWLSLRLARRCPDPDVVADALQDCFTAVWRDAGRWRGDGELGSWLWGIAVRRLVSRLRTRDRQHALPTRPWTEGDDDASPVPSAEERVLLGVEYGGLGAALQRLSPELRAVVQATVPDGLTNREAAELLGIPHGTVKNRLHRARAQLRAELAGGLA